MLTLCWNFVLLQVDPDRGTGRAAAATGVDRSRRSHVARAGCLLHADDGHATTADGWSGSGPTGTTPCPGVGGRNSRRPVGGGYFREGERC